MDNANLLSLQTTRQRYFHGIIIDVDIFTFPTNILVEA
jgi:hypothetical protein